MMTPATVVIQATTETLSTLEAIVVESHPSPMVIVTLKVMMELSQEVLSDLLEVGAEVLVPDEEMDT